MKYNTDKHRRRSIRLKGYDYAQAGTYFVTICAQNRELLLGHIHSGKLIANDAGKMVIKWWEKIQERFNNVNIDEFVIMPNHIHGILMIENHNLGEYMDSPLQNLQYNESHNKKAKNVGVDPCINPSIKTNTIQISDTIIGLPRYISWFKRMTTNDYIKNVCNKNWQPFDRRLWQRNYYDHIIRSEEELKKYRQYIQDNPLKWLEDEENPDNIKN